MSEQIKSKNKPVSANFINITVLSPSWALNFLNQPKILIFRYSAVLPISFLSIKMPQYLLRAYPKQQTGHIQLASYKHLKSAFLFL